MFEDGKQILSATKNALVDEYVTNPELKKYLTEETGDAIRRKFYDYTKYLKKKDDV